MAEVWILRGKHKFFSLSRKNRHGVMLVNIFFKDFSAIFQNSGWMPFNVLYFTNNPKQVKLFLKWNRQNYFINSQRHHVLQSCFIWQHHNAVFTSKWVIISTYGNAVDAEPPSPEHSRVSKSTDFIIRVKMSRHNARNFDRCTRLTQVIHLNNQAIPNISFARQVVLEL